VVQVIVFLWPAGDEPQVKVSVPRRAAVFSTVPGCEAHPDGRTVRLGGASETSEDKWNDLRNIIRVQGEQLDAAYLRERSRELGVPDLLVRLLSE
jgi:hypothetical protein